MLLASVVNVDKKYSEMFLKECKYGVRKKKMMNTIGEKLKLDESDDD